MTADLERRSFADPIELRRAPGSNKLTAAGYAYRFRHVSRFLGNPEHGVGFYERIHPGAALESIRHGGVMAFYNHDPAHLLGRQEAGTLRLREDGTGLFYEVDLPDTSVGRDVAYLLERGDLRGSSFGFVVREYDYTKHEGERLRNVRLMDLIEVSPVARPAYPDSTAGLAGATAAAIVAAQHSLAPEPATVGATEGRHHPHLTWLWAGASTKAKRPHVPTPNAWW